MQIDRKGLEVTTFLYDEEIVAMNKFLEEHRKCVNFEEDMAPLQYTLSFLSSTIADMPSVTCVCGKTLDLACEERYNNV
jgi:hypothetical protein